MKFLTLHIKNFLTISSAAVQLKDCGLHLIQGVNDDDSSAASNGAGKSSLVDAICWALFGQTARGVTTDDVINRVAKKGTEVHVAFSVGDTTYGVSRYRKHKEFKNQLVLQATSGGTTVDLSKGTDAQTQKELERVLGCSYEVFMAAVYSGQEVMPDLPSMKDRELKRLIEESAGMNRIERAYEIALKENTDAAKVLARVQVQIENAKSFLNTTDVAIKKTSVDFTAFEAGRGDRVKNQEERLDDVRGTVKVLAQWVRDNSPTKAEFTEAAERIKQQLESHQDFVRKSDLARATFDRADRAIDRAGLERLVKEIQRWEGALRDAPAEMAKPCGECGKPHTPDELEEFKAHLVKKVEGLRNDMTLKKADVSHQVFVANQAKEEWEKARAAIPDVSAISADMTKFNAFIADFNRKVADLNTGVTAMKAEEARLEQIKTEANPHASGIESLKAMFEERQKDLDKALAELEAAKTALDVAESVCKVFGPAGVRAQILDTVTPFLNDRTADYLSALSDGHITAVWTTLTKSASGDLKEKFSIEAANDTGSESFKGLSGGEKRKVRLATALALQDLVASRAANPIDLWVGDEVDDALDSHGQERLMVLLERKARERGTVLVISHNELRDWCDEVTIVRKSGGASTVEGSLCF